MDDLIDRQIRADRALSLPDQIALIGLVAMQMNAVLMRVDRDGRDAQLGGCTEDANRDLPAVGTEELLDGLGRGSHAASVTPRLRVPPDELSTKIARFKTAQNMFEKKSPSESNKPAVHATDRIVAMSPT